MSTQSRNPDDLEKMIAAPAAPETAPDCRDYEMRIARDGAWYHQGGRIDRMALVKLFSTVLRRDEAGDFWLVTPVERGRIEVEDAPFVAVELRSEGGGQARILTFRTNLDHICGPVDDLFVVFYDDNGVVHRGEAIEDAEQSLRVAWM